MPPVTLKTLPPGLSAAAFAAALKDLKAVVGASWVLSDEDDLDIYRDPYSLTWNTPHEYLASAAVLPQTVEEVQAVVRLANKHKLPLYPISTGKNLTYGGAAPTLSGSVIVDLKRMNKILEVDQSRAFALVEPGVSYFDLYREIQDKGLKLWIDPPEPGWGSPIGNALERGVGFTASGYRDHYASHCGLEVVLPTGEIMRTGMGALPGAESWQDFRYGIGPEVDGLFAQGNFGIVTKMGLWLMPQPECWMSGIVDVPVYTDIDALVDAINVLEDGGVTNGKPFYNSPPFHPFEGNYPGAGPKSVLAELMADGWPTLEATKAHARHHGGPSWWVTLQFYGPGANVRARWEHCQEFIVRAIPGATFRGEQFSKLPLTPEQQKGRHLADFGIPNLSIFQKSPAEVDADELHAPVQTYVDFMAVIPRSGAAIMKAQRVLYETQKAMGAPLSANPFQAPTAWFHRSFLIGAPTTAVYQGDPDQNAKGRALYAAYVKAMAAAGFGVYRTTPAMQDLAVDQYSFGDHALLKFQQRLKDAVDPNGVIAPGRYGVWPKAMRK